MVDAILSAEVGTGMEIAQGLLTLGYFHAMSGVADLENLHSPVSLAYWMTLAISDNNKKRRQLVNPLDYAHVVPTHALHSTRRPRSLSHVIRHSLRNVAATPI